MLVVEQPEPPRLPRQFSDSFHTRSVGGEPGLGISTMLEVAVRRTRWRTATTPVELATATSGYITTHAPWYAARRVEAARALVAMGINVGPSARQT